MKITTQNLGFLIYKRYHIKRAGLFLPTREIYVKQPTHSGDSIFKTWIGFSTDFCFSLHVIKHLVLVSIRVEKHSDLTRSKSLEAKNKLHCLLVYNW